MTGPVTAEFRAMGTGITVATTSATALPSALRVAAAELASIERACSRFLPDSDLTRVNVSGGDWVEVGSVMIEALEVALRAAEATQGLVDLTAGSAVIAAGYEVDFETLAKDGPAVPLEHRPIPGWRRVEVDVVGRLVRVPRGVLLDLGATAKGLAADRAAAAGAAACGAGVLVSCGGDIAAAGQRPEGGWSVRVVEHHADPVEAPGQTVLIQSGGVATSGTGARRWRRGGQVMHHIIDPRTGVPAVTPWRAVTVVAATCADANAASTAAMILGESAVAWLEAGGLAARLIRDDRTLAHTGGWPVPLGAEVTA